MRSLTGNRYLDFVELLLFALLVAYAAVPRPKWLQVGAAVGFVVLAVDVAEGAVDVIMSSLGLGVLMGVIGGDFKSRRIAAGIGVCALLAVVPTAVVAMSARAEAGSARERLLVVRGKVASDPQRVTVDLEEATRTLARVDARLNNVATKPARLVPFVALQLEASSDLLEALRGVVETAKLSVRKIAPRTLNLENGRVPIERLAALKTPALDMQQAAERAHRQAKEIQRRLLVPPLSSQAGELVREAAKAAHSAAMIAELAEQAPGFFGGRGSRRYFVLVQNPAEARASGGILGAYAEVTATNGQLALSAVGRDADLNDKSARRPLDDTAAFASYRRLQPKRFWQNMTFSPDFPTVAAQIEREYESIEKPVDGVISIDPRGLAAVLSMTGPVRVPNWTEPLTADNVEEVFLHDQYARFAHRADYPNREAFMAGAVAAIWGQVTSISDVALDKTLAALGSAVEDGHIAMHASRPLEQQLIERGGLSGAFPTVDGDVLAVVSQNVGATKLDYFTRRTVVYEPEIQTDGSLNTTVTVRFRNEVLPGEPDYVAGPNAPNVKRDHNPQFLRVYSPHELTRASVNGSAVAADIDRDLGLNVFSVAVDVPPWEDVEVKMQLVGSWSRRSDYELVYRRQPMVHGDDLLLKVKGRPVEPVEGKGGDAASVRRYRVGVKPGRV